MAKHPKSVIVLSGVSNAGKTTTLRKVVTSLAASGYARLDSAGDDISQTGGDIRAAFDVNGSRVGICTAGDTADIVKSSITWAIELEIDILVMASKSTGITSSVETIVTTSVEWNVYPVFLALMTYPGDVRRNYHETEMTKRIVNAIRQKTIAL